MKKRINKEIQIRLSPICDHFIISGGFEIKLHAPYSKDEVTVLIDSNIQRDLNFINTPTARTSEICFDLKKNRTNLLKLGDEQYEINLLSIALKNNEGNKQDYLYFEFIVSKIKSIEY